MLMALALLGAYLLGSIPAAYLAGRLAKGIDLREHGSGNLGFTNAWRLLGPGWSIPVLVVDILKGVAAVWCAFLAAPALPWMAIGCGLAAIIGHTCTVFLGFRGGGKGVATSAGVFATLMPLPFLAAALVFCTLLFSLRIMSVASMAGALTLSGAALGLALSNSAHAPAPELIGFSLITTVLLIVRHHSNIRRLLSGTEPRMQFSRKESN